MRLALYIWPWQDEMRTIAAQLGVSDAVCSLPAAGPGLPMAWDFGSLLVLRQRFADAGLDASVIEASPPMDSIRRGLPGAEAEFEQVAAMIQNMGAAGYRIWCYNWMAGFNWLRTSTTTRARGGALVSSYDHALLRDAPPALAEPVPEERLWDTYAAFVERIVPVAEAANVKLALHPDDPPLSPIRGVGRIFRSVDAFERALALSPSAHHGITFCQGNFRLMTDDIPGAVRRFGATGRVHFVHFRDVRGTPERFEETFHDDGPTDMLSAMAAYREIGFGGPMRPDHVPALAGEPNEPVGYTLRGRLYAVGYMRGLMEATQNRSV